MNTIDDKMNMIYDFIYSKSYTGGINIGKINESKINIDDIKYSIIKDDNTYQEYCNELLNGKFKEIGFDRKTNTFYLKRYGDGHSSLLLITPYIDKIDELDNTNNNDALFEYILSPLVLHHHTNNIALPIINIDMHFEELEKILKPYTKIYDDYKEMIENGRIKDVFSVRVRENFFKSVTLNDFLTSGDIIKNILFQVIHCLAVLQKHYSGFRHNMLNQHSVFIYLKKSVNPSSFSFDDEQYIIPQNNCDIKIFNFGNASIPKSFGMNNNANDYYDLYTFLLSILEITDIKDSDTIDFLNEIIPEKYRKFDENIPELFKPRKLLDHKYFAEFKKNISKEKYTDMMANDEYYTNRKKIEKKGSRKLKTELTGGAGFYKPPQKAVKNDPFITNESRRIYTMEKKYMDKPEVKKEDKNKDVIAEQKIIRNPLYKKPFKPKPVPTWEHEYVPPMPTANVPKAKYTPPGDIASETRRKFIEPSDKPEEDKPEEDKPIDINSDEIASETRRKFMDPSEKPKDINSDEIASETRRKFMDPSDKSPIRKPFEHKREYSPPREHKPYEHKHDYSPPREHKPYEHKPRDYSPTREHKYEHKPQEEYYRQKQQPNIVDQPLLAEQKIYQTPSMMPPPVGHTHPKYGGPAWVPIDNMVSYPPGFVWDPKMAPLGGIMLKKPNEIPLQKIYNINLGNPAVHDSVLNNIYEDMIGGDPRTYTMASVYERTQLINMLRHRLIKVGDGEEMSLQPGTNSIMEYIRILRFNPYGLGKNPYADIPQNFLIYSGAYPIRYNIDSREIEIAKHPMSVNIRVYNMNEGAMINDDRNNMLQYDQWRDVHYYNYIRDNIVKTKISPNFITFILYKMDKVSNIKYDVLKQIKETHQANDIILRVANNYHEINKVIENDPELKKMLDKPASDDSGTSMILLTEAPTCNLLEWASPKIVNVNNSAINKMTATGEHSIEAWRSVLFQIAYAMAVLQEKQIYIAKFNIMNNIFIKDIFSDINNLGHWIYNINDIDMYVPNYGHIVVIDTRYVDIDTINTHKITGALFGENVNDMVINDFRNIFKQEIFTNENMLPPPKEVLDIIDKLGRNTNNNIRDIIIECFPEYMHNRVGTLLTKTERDTVQLTMMPKLNQGRMVVYQSRYDEYKWAIYVGDENNKKKIYIINRMNDKVVLEPKTVFAHALFEHPESDSITQLSEKTFRLDKTTLIDSYKFI